MSEGRCMRCKEKVEIKDAKKTKSVKGKEYMRGSCPKCGTTVCTFKLD